jgi:asparagine synthase (glutamine-hydrolysing)
MCRIYGYFNTEVSPSEVRTVAALQRHGGPDSNGTVRSDGWGLGNNRLAIIDLDGGAQPYRLHDRITAVFNGEIYNHGVLRARLRGFGYEFPDRCDGAIIPALYDHYGESFVDEIDGMYAIAILDGRAEPTIVLATDHVGMKPLYYHWDPVARSLRFSSEIPALLGFRAPARTIWEPGLDSYLATKAIFGEQTMFADIKVLPPAGMMRCVLGAAPILVTRPMDRGRAFDDLDQAGAFVREQLRTEVRRLQVADVPVAVITSGGLDSSLVTALAAEDRRPHSFNIAYRGTWPFDEREYARLAAERAGAVYHQVQLDPATLPRLIEDVVWHLGQPNADPISVSTYALFEAVHAAGFKVALTGDAADEVFGGYSRMRAASDAVTTGAPWLSGYLDELAVLPADRRASLYTDDYRALIGETVTIPGVEELSTGPGTVLQRITEFEIRHRLPSYHLRRVDHLSMASSVEARLPFCQRAMVALGRALPDRLRIRDGAVKRTLYAAAGGLLPDPVLSRPKQPFTLPITAMLAPASPLWEYARDILTPRRLRSTGQLNPTVVDALFRAQSERPEDTTALIIWALMVYEVWREQFHGHMRIAMGAAAA